MFIVYMVIFEENNHLTAARKLKEKVFALLWRPCLSNAVCFLCMEHTTEKAFFFFL